VSPLAALRRLGTNFHPGFPVAGGVEPPVSRIDRTVWPPRLRPYRADVSRVPDPPLRAGHPCGRRMGPLEVSRPCRGLTARVVAPLLVLRSPGTHSGVTRSSESCQGSEAHAPDPPLIVSRASTGHHGNRCRNEQTGLALLGFVPLQRLRCCGFGYRGCSRPATFRPQRFPRSRRLTPRNPSPGLFRPGNALGVQPSGLWSSTGGAHRFRSGMLSCRSPQPQWLTPNLDAASEP
jgi:hypothetical protein